MALLIAQDYPCAPINLQTDLQAVAAKVHIRSTITICSLYLPPSVAINQNSLNNLISQLPKPFIILGDMNGHNPLWGSPNINYRGKQIEQLIQDHNLSLLNTNEITYFHSPNRTYHHLDLAICSPQLYPLWNLQVDADLHNSDHFPVILTDVTHVNPNQCIPRYIFDSADWNLFRSLAKITRDMVENTTIDEAVELITNTIIHAADSSMRKSFGSYRRQTKPWWNQDCQNAYKSQRRAWNVFKRYPTMDNFLTYKKHKAIFRRILRRSQKDSWAKYINSITTSTPCKIMWDKVRRSYGVYPNNQIHFLEINNQTISSINDISNAIASTFAYTSSKTNCSPSFMKRRIFTEKNKINFHTKRVYPYNSDLTELELYKALQSASNSSAGPDNISYCMIRNLSPSSLSNLLFLFNRIWHEHTYPTSWRMAIIIPIIKPNKVPKNPLNYRPIALTSCLSKTLEKIISDRLNYHLETHNCLSLNQSGFRRGRSTIDNIVDLENKIRNAFVKRHHMVSIFFDIEKAYDRTWRYGILQQLYSYDMRGNLPIFIENFLSLRNFKVRVGNCFSNTFIARRRGPTGQRS